jgi:hypothetical protein
MATENNKNVVYPNYKDLYKRQRINTNSVVKTALSDKINLFVNAIKEKHL